MGKQGSKEDVIHGKGKQGSSGEPLDIDDDPRQILFQPPSWIGPKKWQQLNLLNMPLKVWRGAELEGGGKHEHDIGVGGPGGRYIPGT